MNNINLEKLNQDIRLFVKERDWEQFHSVKNLSMAMTKEAAELMEIFQWMKEEDSNLVTLDLSKRAKVEDELADVFLYMMRILDKTGIDLESAVRNKMMKNAEKYPIQLAKGNAKKYSEF
jgi:dCTP diphosphatase